LTAPPDHLLLRFRRVFAHVEAHLDGDLGLWRLSRVAAFSKFHFHRQFSALFGLSVHEYVRLVRLKRAAYQLAFRRGRILEVALESGYESHEAFSRAFKKAHGQTPSEFRESPRWDEWHATNQRLTEMRSQYMRPEYQPGDVNIVSFPATRVAVLEHRGDPRRIGESVRRFIEWRKKTKLTPNVSRTFNIFYDDPAHTAPKEYRLDLCAATDRGVPENEFGVVEKTIPRGRCAVLRHVGSDDTLAEALRYLYAAWLPSSGEEPRDFPLFMQRIRFFPDVPETEAVSDIFLPLK
jgi:AraC family transcriptional regulator